MRKLLLISLAVVAFFLLAFSAKVPWFQVPTADGSFGQSEIVPCDMAISASFRLALSLLTLAWIGCWLWNRRSTRANVILASVGLILAITFPHFILAMESPTTARAAWIQIQHENLSWFGGDIFRSHEYRHLPSQVRLFVSDSPRQLALADLPTWSPSEISLNQLPTMMEWMGYNNTFCQFFASGWSSAVVGSAFLVLLSVFRAGELHIKLVQTAVKSIVVGSLLCASCGIIRPIAASHRVTRAAEATHTGQYALAVKHLGQAAKIWPPLRQDTWYVMQRGLLEQLLGRDTQLAHLYRASQFACRKQRDLAEAEYVSIARTATPNSAVSREACRGILRSSMQALNSAEVQRAERGFQQVLRLDPCCIKALYGLQMTALRLGDDELLLSANAQFESVYESLKFPNRKIVLAAAHEMAERSTPRTNTVTRVP